MKKFALILVLLIANLTLIPLAGLEQSAFAREALLMQGKKTLYRRIVTKPGSQLLSAASPSAQVIKGNVPAFAVYYVYGEQDGFTEVGINSRGDAAGWIASDKVVDWKQSIVVAFNNRAEAGRVRHLFFKDFNVLADDIEAYQTPDEFANSPDIVAVEPENAINDNNNFYLLPILDHESIYFPDDNEGNMLQVGSVTAASARRTVEDFRAGVVFVIDTTISMGPYIRQTKEVIEQIGVQLENSPLAGKVSFGLVGYRQSTSTNPGIGYNVKNLLPLDQHSDVNQFLAAIDNMDVAKVPTVGFDEDAIGGIAFASNDNNWQPYAAKYMILVTDAGAKSPEFGDNYAHELDIPELAGDLNDKGIRLLVMHLKTPAGKKDHRTAELQYRQASRLVGSMNDLYTDVSDGSVRAFGNGVSLIASQIVTTSQDIQKDKEIQEPDANDNSTEANMRRAAKAFQLEYRGNQQGEQAPEFYRAWTIDRAFAAYARQALDIRILLTKNQLSTMAQNLREIVDQANKPGGIIDANAFFRSIQDLALRTSNDPTQIRDDQSLGDAIAEYLDDLPYKSQTTAMTMADWVTLSAPEQRDIMNGLESKLRYYERVHSDPDRWFDLHENAAPGEAVTTISLDRMP
ncbi:vWA domain-containing protein [uncultured Cohaesibacter sp.]|uniref:vWA domain-containing protein n=1 Tax=uncultured Cohaesibacter sp. TaxID=1002546 RepID=UPI002AA7A96C|nr:vWA domain-containing protein [uncultured Cohaesibacter sp.]